MNFEIDDMLAQNENAESFLNHAQHLINKAAVELEISPMELLDWLRQRMYGF